MEEIYILWLIGAGAALLRNVDKMAELQKVNKNIKQTLKEINWFLVIKNIALGGFAGVLLGTDYWSAATAGLAGEWTVSKLVNNARRAKK